MSDLAADLCDLAARLAVSAGTLVFEGRKNGVTAASTKSSDTDVVTEFDRASERLIVEGLSVERPYDGLVGEEGAAASSESGVRWLIDPVDGTTNFLYGLPGYAVSIAAVADDRPLVGVVYVPASAELFTAVAERGATLNGAPIRCSTTSTLEHALVATGFSYQRERRRYQGERFAQMIPRIRDVRRLGAASTDLCYLAAGRIDAYYEQWLGPWDWAAGELIAREAGCRTGRFDGRPLSHGVDVPSEGPSAEVSADIGPSAEVSADIGEVMAANPALFEQMVELLTVTEPAWKPGIM